MLRINAIGHRESVVRALARNRGASLYYFCLCLCLCLWCVLLRSAAFRCVPLAFFPRLFALKGAGILTFWLALVPAGESITVDHLARHRAQNRFNVCIVNVERARHVLNLQIVQRAAFRCVPARVYKHKRENSDDIADALSRLPSDRAPLRIDWHIVPQTNPIGHNSTFVACSTVERSRPIHRPIWLVVNPSCQRSRRITSLRAVTTRRVRSRLKISSTVT